jgi:diguanylate cyclase (GGDEF)-like protein/PAS domain S-box-containing protein
MKRDKFVDDAARPGSAVLRSFFESAPFQMGITELTADNDLLLVSVNPATAAALGMDLDQVQGKKLSELGLAGPGKGVWLDHYSQVLRTHEPLTFEQPSGVLGSDDWWQVTLAYLGIAPSGQPRFSYVVQDITERKREQQTQAALYRISEAAQSEATLSELFRKIHEIIGELLPAKNFFVALYDKAKDELTFPYHVDEFDPPPAPHKLTDGTLSGRVITLGQALLFTPETPNEGVHKEDFIVGAPSLDWLGVPLKTKSGTIGALVVQSYAGDVRYDERDKSLLEFVSGQVAAAIERKQSEEAIVASETRFRLLFEQNLAGVFRTRPDGQILECNTAFARMLGYDSREEIMKLNASAMYFNVEDRERNLAKIRQQGALDNSVIRLRRKDGSELWGMESVNVIREHPGAGEILQGTLIDFTSHRAASEALRLSESRLEEAQRLANLGSWNWDRATKTLTWSDELCRIYGVDPATHVPSFEDMLSRLPAEDREHVAALYAHAFADKKPFSHETRIVRPDGEIRTVADQTEVLVDEDGAVTALAGACLDITVRKRGELLEHDRGRILEQVAQDEPLPGILMRVAETLEHQLPGMRACLLQAKNGGLAGGACPSFPPDFATAVEALSTADRSSSFGVAALTGMPAIVADTATDPGWRNLHELCEKYQIRACWTVPILSANGGTLGTLSLVASSPRAATDADRQLLESVCRLAAVAIDHRELTDMLSHQAQHDALTGLPNRLLFQDRLSQALALAKRNGQQVAVIYMDLDRFKHINDTLGHSSGDELLCQTAERLDACVRRSDTLARLGGDEFTVVLTELSDPQDAMRAAKDMIEAMRVPFTVEGRELFVTMSLGISIFPDDGVDSETLMVHADVAMYRAKELGRDNFQWFAAEMNTLARERMELEGQLRYAMQLGQLSLAYQPQCGARGEILAFEALMRWRHPVLGDVSPARFIPLAEDSGLIISMGEWALRKACAQTAEWRAAGHPALRISVNVSAAQFNRPDWVDTVRRALHDTQLTPEALELEITESLLLESVRETSANLFELRALGVGVAIDDFGTGYSSLSYLHKLPISTLKIDQSFVREIGLLPVEGQEDAPIIRTIIALAHNLGLAVVAEGVETEAQRALLLRLGCEGLQGHLLHPALDVAAARELLDQQQRRASTS